MRVTSTVEGILCASEKGYKVDKFGGVIGASGKTLATLIDSRGYKKFNIRCNGNHRCIRVHQLQAYQKFGSKSFEDDMVVRHLDNDSLNNQWDNLELGTHKDNMNDMPKGYRNTYNTVELMLDYEEGMPRDVIIAKYGIRSRQTLYRIIKRCKL
jgi:hypothetical protein|tara:strand:+ start:44 stop:505 length:462 start_codon:yes stop_codon:yes gene_type:complete